MQLHHLVLVLARIAIALAHVIKHNDLDKRIPTFPETPTTPISALPPSTITASASLTSSPAQILQQCPACQVLGQALAICTSLTPAFTNLPATKQAECLCYSSAVWSPNVFDNAVESCAGFASTAVPTVYGIMSALEDFCENLGDVEHPATVSTFTIVGYGGVVITTPDTTAIVALTTSISTVTSSTSSLFSSTSAATSTSSTVGSSTILTAGGVGTTISGTTISGTVSGVLSISASADGVGFSVSGITVSGGVIITAGTTTISGTTGSENTTPTTSTKVTGQTSISATSTKVGATSWTYNAEVPTRTAAATGAARELTPDIEVVFIGFAIAIGFAFL